MKEIHFYECHLDIPAGRPYCRCWHETEERGNNGVAHITTTQMGLLSTSWLEKGYRVFVHVTGGASFEIRIGASDGTDKEIRPAHNLFRMWQSGAFDPSVRTV